MEHTGLEPVTSTLPVWRAPNCANAPNKYIIAYEKMFVIKKIIKLRKILTTQVNILWKYYISFDKIYTVEI